jgi:hypothetical protein
VSAEEKLAEALNKFASAIERQTRVLEVLTESIPVNVEAKLTGVSRWTITKRRKARKIEKLLS